MNILEIDQSLDEISAYLGAKVQSISFTKTTLVLGLYHEMMSKSVHLIFAAKPPRSALILTEDRVPKVKSETKPLYLFAKAHLSGAQLLNVQREEESGRVVHLDFVARNAEAPNTNVRLTQNLIPAVWNLSLDVNGRTVFLNKPKDIPALIPQSEASKGLSSQLGRIKNETLAALLNAKGKVTKEIQVPPIEKEISKKQKLLHKLQTDLEDKIHLNWDEFAELVVTDIKEAAHKFPHFFDGSQSVFVQQKEAYEKHKKNIQKIQRLRERLQELSAEIEDLKALTPEQWSKLYRQKQTQHLQSPKGRATQKNSKVRASIEARKLELAQDCVVYLGKSAQDNLRLLRQAKAWHYWIHVKDRSSAYALMQCPKDKKVAYGDLVKVMRWWREASSSFGKSFQEWDKVSILVTQCRYVRPIKGDKLGRVNYSHEQVFTISL